MILANNGVTTFIAMGSVLGELKMEPVLKRSISNRRDAKYAEIILLLSLCVSASLRLN